jgi:hypothetical protein
MTQCTPTLHNNNIKNCICNELKNTYFLSLFCDAVELLEGGYII